MNTDKKIIYPDSNDERVFEALKILLQKGEQPVICGTQDDLKRYQELIHAGLEYREILQGETALDVATKSVANREAYGCIAGNISATREVIQAYLKNIGVEPGISRISSHFLLQKGHERILYADAAIQIDPSAEQLAEIGYLTIESARKYGMSPKLAFLSFSTAGSGGDHPKVQKVREATDILRQRLEDERVDDVIVEGEIQFDAAYIAEIGLKKNTNTKLQEPANIFIFPDLDSANIAYKITERLAGYEAIGPVIQGLKYPANDLSRGCSVEDIVAMHFITKNQ